MGFGCDSVDEGVGEVATVMLNWISVGIGGLFAFGAEVIFGEALG